MYRTYLLKIFCVTTSLAVTHINPEHTHDDINTLPTPPPNRRRRIPPLLSKKLSALEHSLDINDDDDDTENGFHFTLNQTIQDVLNHDSLVKSVQNKFSKALLPNNIEHHTQNEHNTHVDNLLKNINGRYGHRETDQIPLTGVPSIIRPEGLDELMRVQLERDELMRTLSGRAAEEIAADLRRMEEPYDQIEAAMKVPDTITKEIKKIRPSTFPVESRNPVESTFSRNNWKVHFSPDDDWLFKKRVLLKLRRAFLEDGPIAMSRFMLRSDEDEAMIELELGNFTGHISWVREMYESKDLKEDKLTGCVLFTVTSDPLKKRTASFCQNDIPKFDMGISRYPITRNLAYQNSTSDLLNVRFLQRNFDQTGNKLESINSKNEQPGDNNSADDDPTDFDDVPYEEELRVSVGKSINETVTEVQSQISEAKWGTVDRSSEMKALVIGWLSTQWMSGGCQRNYTAICPLDWNLENQNGKSICKAPQNGQQLGFCDNLDLSQFKHRQLISVQKKLAALAVDCMIEWPCMHDYARDLDSDRCPVGWRLAVKTRSDELLCLAPSRKGRRCSPLLNIIGMDIKDKARWAYRCGEKWPIKPHIEKRAMDDLNFALIRNKADAKSNQTIPTYKDLMGLGESERSGRESGVIISPQGNVIKKEVHRHLILIKNINGPVDHKTGQIINGTDQQQQQQHQ